MFKNRETKIIWCIVLAVFVVSLVLSFSFKTPPIVDARAYDRIAMNIVAGNGYIEDSSVEPKLDFSIARVGPGYEFFLAGVYKTFGHHYGIIWFFQAIFHALSALLIFLISKQLFGKCWEPLIGYSSAVLVGFSSDLLVASSMLLTENMAVFLMLLSVYFFFRYYDFNKWSNFVLFTIFFIFSVTVRSQLAVFLPIFLMFFIWKKEWLKISVFLLLVILLFSPWVIRNYKIYDTFIPFNAALGHNLWTGNHLGATGEMEPYEPEASYTEKYGALATHKEGMDEFKRFVSEYPLEFTKITLKRISIFFSFVRPSGFWMSFTPKQQIITAGFSFVYSILILTLGVSGMLLYLKNNFKRYRKKILFFLAMAFSIPFSVMIILIETRYRFNFYPFLAIFSGYLISEIWIDRSKIKFLVLTFLILLLNSTFDFIFVFERLYDKFKNVL